jgi:hypothetical protein
MLDAKAGAVEVTGLSVDDVLRNVAIHVTGVVPTESAQIDIGPGGVDGARARFEQRRSVLVRAALTPAASIDLVMQGADRGLRHHYHSRSRTPQSGPSTSTRSPTSGVAPFAR